MKLRRFHQGRPVDVLASAPHGPTHAIAHAVPEVFFMGQTPEPIAYVRGDATAPQGEEPKIIAHICNDIGGWGKGFVMALSKRWPQPEQAYRDWHRERGTNDFGLGAVQLVPVEEDLWVANMVGQRDVRTIDGVPPIRYEAVDRCLAALAQAAAQRDASVHMPRIGCGLAGGSWDQIEPLIEKQLIQQGISVTVYDFE